MPSGRRIDTTELARRAKSVLDTNRRGSWTCPSVSLYPHQWLWDSCFVAIGLAGVDPPRAAGELRAVFRGQWTNGMLPHMLFAPDVPDVGSTRIWQSRRNPLAPRDIETSCITQPPVVAIAAWRVAQALAADERVAFLREVLPKLVAYHEWLYRERDPDQSGLVTLIHPWECGLDTTPPWMQALARMPSPWWARAATRFHLAHVLRFLRRDTKYVPSVQRPTDDEGLRMLVLAQLGKRHGFELRRMPRDRSVLIQDLAFNAILAAANRSLLLIADELGEALPPDLMAHFARTPAALEALWDDDAGEYYSRDAVTGARLRTSTIATFLPLLADVPSPERAQRLIARLHAPSGYWPRFPVPTVPTDAPEFRDEAYWRGPTWLNMNWMIVEALELHDEHDLADVLRHRSLELVDGAGCREYFSPLTGRGYGAPDFSWTAALTLELLAHSH